MLSSHQGRPRKFSLMRRPPSARLTETKYKHALHSKVNKDDIIYMKESGGLVKGQFTVAKVKTFDTITSVDVLDIYANYGQQIFGMRHFSEEWDECYKSGLLAEELKDWNNSKYATLIHITALIPFPKPFRFPKRDQRSWVLLDAPLKQSLTDN